MHFEMSSAICFDLDQSKILSSGNRLSLFSSWYDENSLFHAITGKSQSFNMQYRVASNVPIDMYFVLDFSTTMATRIKDLADLTEKLSKSWVTLLMKVCSNRYEIL